MAAQQVLTSTLPTVSAASTADQTVGEVQKAAA
jgi:hypothetical protein